MTNKLFKQFKKYSKNRPEETVELGGILGLPVASKTVIVPGRSGYVYVRLRNTNEIVQAFNDKTSNVYNLPVLLQWSEGRYKITSRDSKRYQNWGENSSFVPSHGHYFEGGVYVQNEGVPLGTGTTLNFVGSNVDATISGSVVQVYISGSAGSVGGIAGIVGQNEGVVIGTGTIVNFVGDNVDASISGSVIRVFVTGSVKFAQYYSAEEVTLDALGDSYLPIELMRYDPYNLMDIVLTGIRSGTSVIFNEPGWYRVETDLYLYPDSVFFDGNISAKHYTAPYTGTTTFQAREFQYPTQESSQQNWTDITLSETFYTQGQQEIRTLVTNNTTGTVYSALISMTIEKLG